MCPPLLPFVGLAPSCHSVLDNLTRTHPFEANFPPVILWHFSLFMYSWTQAIRYFTCLFFFSFIEIRGCVYVPAEVREKRGGRTPLTVLGHITILYPPIPHPFRVLGIPFCTPLISHLVQDLNSGWPYGTQHSLHKCYVMGSALPCLFFITIQNQLLVYILIVCFCPPG